MWKIPTFIMIPIGSSDIFQGQPQRLQGFVRWQLQWQAPFWARISGSVAVLSAVRFPTGRASTLPRIKFRISVVDCKWVAFIYVNRMYVYNKRYIIWNQNHAFVRPVVIILGCFWFAALSFLRWREKRWKSRSVAENLGSTSSPRGRSQWLHRLHPFPKHWDTKRMRNVTCVSLSGETTDRSFFLKRQQKHHVVRVW